MQVQDAISKEKCQQISAEIDEAIKSILAKHEITVSKRSSKYGELFKYTLEAVAVQINEDGINLASPDVTAFQRMGYSGWVPSNQPPTVTKSPQGHEIVTGLGAYTPITAPIGTRFVSNGKVFAFAGIRSRGKNVILGIEIKTKKTFVFADQIIPTLNSSAK
jgi:hypothetical protein